MKSYEFENKIKVSLNVKELSKILLHVPKMFKRKTSNKNIRALHGEAKAKLLFPQVHKGT